jgi:hypothetical protein
LSPVLVVLFALGRLLLSLLHRLLLFALRGLVLPSALLLLLLRLLFPLQSLLLVTLLHDVNPSFCGFFSPY